MSSESDERRHDVRAPVSIMGTVESEDGEQPMVLLNLSASGAMIQAHQEPPPSATCTLRFSIHKQPYELRLQVVHWLRQGDSFGWRGPFVSVPPGQAQAIERAVRAAMGLSDSSIRAWREVIADAEHQPDSKVLVGSTPAGQDIRVLGKDLLEMGVDGVELYARLMCELETI
ncbi:MAG TPA: PilZ domain-containing protein [Chloroflexota bacterium]|nr:PilZ domain-containing protein [Chloroflexota bacterium]